MYEAISQSRYFVYLSFLYSGLIYYVFKKARSEKMSLNISLDISLIVMVLGLIGARLVHVVWEAPFYYRDHFIEIFKFWNGGFVFYGGAIVALIGSLIFLKIRRENFWVWADFFTPIISIGYSLGRVSCLISGCCYGKTCDLYLPLIDRHPTQVYASLLELINFLLILKFYKNITKNRSGILFLSWVTVHALGRVLMEYFRADFRGDQILQMSFGTLISLILISLSLGLLYFRLTSDQSKVRHS